jgi:cellobiose phosphorylase
VRENGGQYTHAAIWAIMAFAEMGNPAKAWELFNMINPIHRGGDEKAIAVYKVEPYVVAADVYGASPHTGRGGWTWYTGSAGWMYRLVTETLLGLTREPTGLRLNPRLPAQWPGFKLHYRFHETAYHIAIARAAPGSPPSLSIDGTPQSDFSIPLVNDRAEHQIQINLGTEQSPPIPATPPAASQRAPVHEHV